jgi:hypothetical protein
MQPDAGYNVVMVRAEQAIESWRVVPQDRMLATEDFSASQLGFRSAASATVLRRRARHIPDVGIRSAGMLLKIENRFPMRDNRERLDCHCHHVRADAPLSIWSVVRLQMNGTPVILTAGEKGSDTTHLTPKCPPRKQPGGAGGQGSPPHEFSTAKWELQRRSSGV